MMDSSRQQQQQQQQQQIQQQPHPKILIQHLQSKLTSIQENTNSGNNNGSVTTNSSEWTLAQDDQLATTLHSISRYMRQRIQRASRSVEQLEQKQTRLSNLVSVQNTVLLLRNDVQFVANKAAEEDNEDDDHNTYFGGNASLKNQDIRLIPSASVEESIITSPEEEYNIVHNNNSIMNTSKDEKSIASELSSVGNDNNSKSGSSSSMGGSLTDNAIENGMRALSLFLDPALPQPLRRIGGENGDANNANAVLDSCYYYDSVEQDEFNHRPLPYVVGTVEFNDSVTAGLGGVEDEFNYTVDDDGSQSPHQFHRIDTDRTVNTIPHPPLTGPADTQHHHNMKRPDEEDERHDASMTASTTGGEKKHNPFLDGAIEDSSIASPLHSTKGRKKPFNASKKLMDIPFSPEVDSNPEQHSLSALSSYDDKANIDNKETPPGQIGIVRSTPNLQTSSPETDFGSKPTAIYPPNKKNPFANDDYMHDEDSYYNESKSNIIKNKLQSEGNELQNDDDNYGNDLSERAKHNLPPISPTKKPLISIMKSNTSAPPNTNDEVSQSSTTSRGNDLFGYNDDDTHMDDTENDSLHSRSQGGLFE